MADVFQASSRHGSLRRDTQDSSDTVKPIHFQQNVLKPHFELEPISSSGQYVPFPSLTHLNINEPAQLSEQTSFSLSRLPVVRSHLDTPAARTGPPRSLSFARGLPGSPTGSISVSNTYDRAISDHTPVEDNEFNSVNGLNFRGPLENLSPEDRQLGKGKKRERDTGWRSRDDSWNRRTRIHESSKEGSTSVAPSVSAEHDNKTNVDSNIPRLQTIRPQKGDPSEHTIPRPGPEPIATTASEMHSSGQPSFMRRAFSLPYRIQDEKDQKKGDETATSRAKWARLRALLPQITHSHRDILPGPSVITSQAVNITDELITGGLSTLMLKLWFERDEKGHRRVPILLHRLRIRVSDSLHPLYGHKSVFRIECEYANGAAKWVVYRQLRDFLSLHAHYKVSNVYSRNVHKMPEFPTTSLPYFNFLKKEGKEKGDKVGRAEFARLQRESLENYLIELIRAVMFHPSANRLCHFLEMSALFIALAHSGGSQYKAGFLRVESTAAGTAGFGRKSVGWKEKEESRWCAVRESYLVAMDEAGELSVWDVFLLDSDFRIERPKRYYRQVGHLLHHDKKELEKQGQESQAKERDNDGTHTTGRPNDQREYRHFAPEIQLSPPENDHKSIISSIRTHISKVFHHDLSASSQSREERGDRNRDGNAVEAENGSNLSSPSTSFRSVLHSRAPTPLLDPSTNTNPLQDDTEIEGKGKNKLGTTDTGEQEKESKNDGNKTISIATAAKNKFSTDVSKHTFYILNSQTRLKLSAKNERQMLQFITALEKAAASSPYTGHNRFDSFAPIRLNVAAQWLVDGRDYYWNLSRAILLAKESIYIHDWWLSPELFLRRPNKDKYRLDRLLERKAKEGVKIYIILYQEVTNRTTPTDSNYAKQRLIGLHPNVMVQRSPSHFQTGTFYWAHHEKLCVIDHTIAFMGGFDLCFGRWDTPQHVLADDVADTERSEIWPGKDYSNPRISDFYELDKPDQDMYDRTKVPRMPWHDVGVQLIGQPSRDLARHFVQRWNYLLRIKNHTRVMPFLLPPADFRPEELERLCLTGTCELQICRSAGPWSLGTPGRIELSIQNAYLKAIQMSEHFVYIENQFFISSTIVNDVKIENHIGDAIVHRIIRANRDHTPWKCCILIPLLPGFTFPVDHSDASAVRIIIESQNRTICRGPNSIFSRLRKEGIDPDEYISFFSLRNWAKLRGEVLTTEQVYIHGKVCIVDDRLAIIGSANINERSLRGDKDSELAAVIRDTDFIDSTMAGKPFQVGRFVHTLRVRLMREHLGIDVDALGEDDLVAHEPVKPSHEQELWDPAEEQVYGLDSGVTHMKRRTPIRNFLSSGKGNLNQAVNAEEVNVSSEAKKACNAVGIMPKPATQIPTLNEEVPTLEEETVMGQRPAVEQDSKKLSTVQNEIPGDSGDRQDEGSLGAKTNDNAPFGAPADAGNPDADNTSSPRHTPLNEEEREVLESRPKIRNTAKPGVRSPSTRRPEVGQDDFEDPICDKFWQDIWVASAVYNTEIFRDVFHAIPDDLVTTWKKYKEYTIQHERLNKPPQDGSLREPVGRVPSEAGDDALLQPSEVASTISKEDGEAPSSSVHGTSFAATSQAGEHNEQERSRRPTKGIKPYETWEKEEMERRLGELNGCLVVFPTKFLEGEDPANNFLFNADRLLPLPIYV